MADDGTQTSTSIQERMRDFHRSAYSIVAHITDKIDKESKGGDVEAKQCIIDTIAFKATIMMLIIANAVLMGVETDHPDLEVWWVTENFFTAAFLMEMLIKLYYMRLDYFKSRGNWLDFSLVILAILDVWITTPLGGDNDMQSYSILRFVRFFRLARFLRLFRNLRKFALIIQGIVDALRATMWVGLLVFTCTYVFAIFCTDHIGRGKHLHEYPGYTTNDAEIDENEIIALFNPYLCFGSMPRSMLTLFNVVIGAEWAEIVRPIAVKQPILCVFFLAFTLFVTYGVMNVIVGMIVDAVIQNARDLEKEAEALNTQGKLEQLKRIGKVVVTMDQDHDGKVTVAELEENMKNDNFREILEKVNLPMDMTAKELLVMLDEDGQGILHLGQIVRGLYRLVDSDSFQRQCLTHLAINNVQAKVQENCNAIRMTQQLMQGLEIAVHSLRGEIRTVLGQENGDARPSQAHASKSGHLTAVRLSEVPSPAREVDAAAPLQMDDSLQKIVQPPAYSQRQEAAPSLESVKEMSKKLELRIADALKNLKVDETNTRKMAMSCGSVARDEVSIYIQKAWREIEWSLQCQFLQMSSDLEELHTQQKNPQPMDGRDRQHQIDERRGQLRSGMSSERPSDGNVSIQSGSVANIDV